MGSKSTDGSEHGRITFHLTPYDDWQRQSEASTYKPEAFKVDGFIHCTDGEENLLNVGNAYYQQDQRPYVVLSIKTSQVDSTVVYEDHQEIYPHIYGPLNVDAVVAVHQIVRNRDGAFLAIGAPVSMPRI